MITGPNSRLVSDVSKVARVFLKMAGLKILIYFIQHLPLIYPRNIDISNNYRINYFCFFLFTTK